ncbi:MAG: hypothetical protein FWD05_13585, partial [Oscillospiraceae bacterium]|nr:hypothetical protein [Oscillospiraceae bacterium]
ECDSGTNYVPCTDDHNDVGNAGNNDAGNAGNDDVGNAGNNNTGNVGNNNAGNTGNNNVGNADNNNTGNASNNNAGNASNNNAGNASNNNAGNARNNNASSAGSNNVANNRGVADSDYISANPAPLPEVPAVEPAETMSVPMVETGLIDDTLDYQGELIINETALPQLEVGGMQSLTGQSDQGQSGTQNHILLWISLAALALLIMTGLFMRYKVGKRKQE